MLIKTYPETIVRQIEYERSSQSHGSGSEDSDITIGIDFGSTNTKVVLRSAEKAQAIAVPFTKDPKNPFLLTSECHQLGNTYSLHPREGSESIRNLKSNLLNDNPNEKVIRSAIAFLALTIRYAKQWFINNYSESWDCGDIEWRMNLGLPARDFEDKELIERFHMVGKVAYKLASYPSQFISDADIINLIKTTKGKGAELDYFVNIFPEISATLHGFVRSDRWDKSRTRVLLIDIGGETVDCTLANARMEGAKVNYSFLGCLVQRRGTIQLETSRIDWLSKFEINDVIKTSLEERKERLSLVKETPQSFRDYLNCDWRGNADNVDRRFINNFIENISLEVLLPAKKAENLNTTNFQNLQTIISGGGALVEHYQKILPIINSAPSFKVSLELLDQRPPDNLIVEGTLTIPAYLRLAVAFGLSHDDIGDFVTPDGIPPLNSDKTKDYRDNMITPDMM